MNGVCAAFEEGSTLPHRYMRVKDKETGHRYDVLIGKFNPDAHDAVTKGPYSGTSQYYRRPQLSVKKAKNSPKKGEETSSAPSGDNKTEKEV